MTRYKITVEYDGTNLVGWQRQDAGLSAQACLEDALFAFSGIKAEIFAAGRTDAGVHATGQVAHFDLNTTMDLYHLREAFNAKLREADAPVNVVDIEIVPSDFHARFKATKRAYLYRLLNRRAPSVLRQNKVWHVNFALDVDKMRQAAAHLLGHHDFSAFRGAGCQAKSPVKTLDRLDIIQKDDEIWFIVEAKSFLYHQVRNMVGTLKLVGDGHLSPDDIPSILESKKRENAGVTAPACGLYLTKIEYDAPVSQLKIIKNRTAQSRFKNQDVEPQFWRHKKLEDLTPTEWELLCDGCGKCCLNKLECQNKIYFTNAHCRFLDPKTCLCRIYEHRFEKVKDCRQVDLRAIREKPRWLPKTCAYVILDETGDLPPWHPLITGKASSVYQAGVSLKNRPVVSESEVEDYEDYIVDWQDL